MPPGIRIGVDVEGETEQFAIYMCASELKNQGHFMTSSQPLT
jgi:hypothetical protein